MTFTYDNIEALLCPRCGCTKMERKLCFSPTTIGCKDCVFLVENIQELERVWKKPEIYHGLLYAQRNPEENPFQNIMVLQDHSTPVVKAEVKQGPSHYTLHFQEKRFQTTKAASAFVKLRNGKQLCVADTMQGDVIEVGCDGCNCFQVLVKKTPAN